VLPTLYVRFRPVGSVEVTVADVDAAIPGRASRLWKRRAIGGLGLDLVAALAGMSPRDALFDEVA